MLVSSGRNETRIALIETNQVKQLFFDRKRKKSIVGNIYLGKVENVLSSLDAAFVDIGEKKNAFLYINEVEHDIDIDEKDKKPVKIHHVLKPNQMILVQVTKDPMKGKGARLTTFISIPGRYMVLAPFNDGVGVSRRLSLDDREKLKEIAEGLKPDDCGIIVRTAAKDAKKNRLYKDLKQLIRLWKELQKRIKNMKEPGLIHEEYSLVTKLLRDIFSDEFNAIYVNSKEVKKEILKYLRSIGYSFNKVILSKHNEDLFDKFGLNEIIESALERKVWLKSGGFIVIDYGEALTSIDVNTGKFTSGKSSAQTILRTNLEAAEVIANQLRLRDIGGLIVIDFIDMVRNDDKEKVLNKFKKCLDEDNTKTEVLSFSKFGLVEMTRKNVSDGIIGTMCKTCPYCEGVGYIKSEETVRLEIERKIMKLSKESSSQAFLIKLNPIIAQLVRGQNNKNIKNLEKATKKYIIIRGDDNLSLDGFVLFGEGSINEIKETAKPFKVDDVVDLTVEEAFPNSNDGLSRVEGYIIRIINGKKYVDERITVKIRSISLNNAVAHIQK